MKLQQQVRVLQRQRDPGSSPRGRQVSDWIVIVVASNVTWPPTTTLTDRAGNTCTTTTTSETGAADVEF